MKDKRDHELMSRVLCVEDTLVCQPPGADVGALRLRQRNHIVGSLREKKIHHDPSVAVVVVFDVVVVDAVVVDVVAVMQVLVCPVSQLRPDPSSFGSGLLIPFDTTAVVVFSHSWHHLLLVLGCCSLKQRFYW